MVEIKQRMDFCGEEIIVTKKVREGSAEELAYRQQGISKASGDAGDGAPKGKMADLGESTLGAGLGAGGTHAIVGPRVHGGPRGGWRVFQPFSGGSVFVLLQATVRAWA